MATSTPAFVADPASVQQSTGHQIDWANVPTDYAGALPAGKFMAELASGLLVPMDSEKIVAEEATHILASAANETDPVDNHGMYGTYVGGVFYLELLPDAEDAAIATYTASFASAGPGARFVTYEDTRAT